MTSTKSTQPLVGKNTAEEPSTVAAVLEALRGLQFGSVTLIVQDGVIVQVERIEKKRLTRPGRKEP